MYLCLNTKWNLIKEFVHILRVPYEATIRLQSVSLTLSDVYGIWLQMKLHLNCLIRKKTAMSLQKHLLDALQDREMKIFDNSAMIIAIFLDPRFRSEIIRHAITSEEDAIEKIKLLWNRLRVLKNGFNERNIDSFNTANGESSLKDCSNISLNDSFDAKLDMDQYLKRGLQNNSNCIQSSVQTEDIDSAILSFNPEWMPIDNSVLDFWEKEKNNQPILYQIAAAIYAVPPTEVQIERNFSNLEKILSKYRMKLSDENLEAILMIHLNAELFYAVKEEEINNLKSIAEIN